MNPPNHRFGAVALAALCSAGAAQANLVTNGSFEAPNIVGGAYQLYAGGATTITGWTVIAPGDSIQLTPDTYMGLKASEGRQWLDLTGIYGYDKGVQSDPFATTVGQHYTVSFDVGNYVPFGPSTLGLSINGGAEQRFTNSSLATTADYPMNWAHFSLDYVATGASTQLSFLGRANGALSNNGGIGLDHVSFTATAVPEPETAALLLVGLGALGFVGRRSRQ
jgi:hypothetical protein